MIFWAELHKDGLHPVYNSDAEKLSKLKLFTEYKFVVTKPRNPKRHKMFFAMLNMVFQNQEQYNNIDELREELTKSAGYFKIVKDLDGNEQRRAKSISFSSMDDIEFDDYYKAVWDVVARWLDMTNEQLQIELVNFL